MNACRGYAGMQAEMPRSLSVVICLLSDDSVFDSTSRQTPVSEMPRF